MVGIIVRDNLVIGRSNEAGRGIKDAGQLLEGYIAPPFVFAGPARHRHQALVSCHTHGDLARRLVANVAVHVGIDEVLAGNIPIAERFAEFLPIPCQIDTQHSFEEMAALEGRPLERHWLGIFQVPNDIVHDRAMVGDKHIQRHRGLVFDFDGLLYHL